MKNHKRIEWSFCCGCNSSTDGVRPKKVQNTERDEGYPQQRSYRRKQYSTCSSFFAELAAFSSLSSRRRPPKVLLGIPHLVYMSRRKTTGKQLHLMVRPHPPPNGCFESFTLWVSGVETHLQVRKERLCGACGGTRERGRTKNQSKEEKQREK